MRQQKMTSFKNMKSLIDSDHNEKAIIKAIFRNMLKRDVNRKLINQSKTCFAVKKRNGYEVASTRKVVYDMAELGFYPFVRSKNHNTIIYNREASRLKKYVNHAKHMIAFTSKDLMFKDEELNKELKIVVLFLNSYHKRTPAEIKICLFRSYCENGLMVPLEFESFSRPHLKTTNPKYKSMKQFLVDAIQDIKGSIETKIVPFIHHMKNIELTEAEQLKFAREMFVHRIGVDRVKDDNDFKSVINMEYTKLLTCHRPEDEGNSIWNVLNRIQENVGGNARKPLDKHGNPLEISYQFIGMNKDGEKVLKKRSLTVINGMKKLIEFNQLMYQYAQQLVDSKKV